MTVRHTDEEVITIVRNTNALFVPGTLASNLRKDITSPRDVKPGENLYSNERALPTFGSFRKILLKKPTALQIFTAYLTTRFKDPLQAISRAYFTVW